MQQQRSQAPQRRAVQQQPLAQAPPPPAPAAAANHAGMHLMAMLGVAMPAAGGAPAMPALPKPASEPKLHPDDEEETIVMLRKQPSATSLTPSVQPPQQQHQQHRRQEQPTTTTTTTTTTTAAAAAAVVPFTPVRHADYARPAAVTAMMADVRARKGYDTPLFKEPPKQRRNPTMPDGTIGFHEGRAAAGLPTVYLNAANLTGRSLTPPEPPHSHLPHGSHLMNHPHENNRVRRVSTDGGTMHAHHPHPQYPHARGFNHHNNMSNNTSNGGGAHPGHARGFSHSNHSNNSSSGKEDGRRPSFHGNSHGSSPAKPKPPTLAPKAGMGAPLPSALSTQNSWRVLAEAA